MARGHTSTPISLKHPWQKVMPLWGLSTSPRRRSNASGLFMILASPRTPTRQDTDHVIDKENEHSCRSTNEHCMKPNQGWPPTGTLTRSVYRRIWAHMTTTAEGAGRQDGWPNKRLLLRRLESRPEALAVSLWGGRSSLAKNHMPLCAMQGLFTLRKYSMLAHMSSCEVMPSSVSNVLSN